MYSYTNKKLLLESYEVISEIDENLIERVLHEAKDVSDSKIDATIKVHKENMKALEKIAKENKIDISSFKKTAQDLAKVAKASFKKGIPVEKASKEAITRVGKKLFKKAVKRYEELTTGEKIGGSILIVLLILFINTIAGVFLTLRLGKIGYFALIVIIGPLVEESAKRYAIVKKYPIVFTTIFAGFEAVTYIARMINMGISLPAALIVRGLSVCLHFTTLFIQMHYHKKAEEEIYDADALELKGYLIAFTVHSLWNLMAIIPQL